MYHLFLFPPLPPPPVTSHLLFSLRSLLVSCLVLLIAFPLSLFFPLITNRPIKMFERELDIAVTLLAHDDFSGAFAQALGIVFVIKGNILPSSLSPPFS